MTREPAMRAVPTIEPATTSAEFHLRRDTLANPMLRRTGLKSMDRPSKPAHSAASARTM
ncbi:MAG: hypothetical protein IIB17_09275 [Chloroflexi bacterium]|nr:hypothetical protein [Chloroflexota bacterium]